MDPIVQGQHCPGCGERTTHKSTCPGGFTDERDVVCVVCDAAFHAPEEAKLHECPGDPRAPRGSAFSAAAVGPEAPYVDIVQPVPPVVAAFVGAEGFEVQVWADGSAATFLPGPRKWAPLPRADYATLFR